MHNQNLLNYLHLNHVVKIKDMQKAEVVQHRLKLNEQTIAKAIDIKPLLSIDSDLLSVMSRRKSSRVLGSITLKEISSILYYSSRVIESEVGPLDYLKTHRPYPSAGGRHPHDIFFLTRNLPDLSDGLWYFDPFLLKAYQLFVQDDLVDNIWNQTSKMLQTKSHCFLILSMSNFERTLSKYENGLNLAWKDAGCLLSTIDIIATAYNLGTCHLGISEEFNSSKFCNYKWLWITGGIAIGEKVEAINEIL